MRRVVITGMGAVTPIGVGQMEFAAALRAGKVGIAPIGRFDTSGFKAHLAAEVTGDITPYLDAREARRMDRYCQFGVAACELALRDAALDVSGVDRERFGVMLGSGIGGMETFERETGKLLTDGPGRVSPFMIPMMIANMAAGQAAIRYGLKGPNTCVVTACASGAHSIGDAFRLIRFGYAERMLAGGCEASITPLGLAGFINITALTKRDDPLRASIPFDRDRDGFVMGEGAGVVLLEEYGAAKARGARIVCEVVGYGATCDAYHMTAPDPDGAGAARAMSLALQEAGIAPEQVDYVNAHGTSTPPNDRMEAKAVHAVFGAHAKDLPVSSTKSMTGHLLGAAGGVEAVVCAIAMRDGFLPPTMGYQTPDPECDLDVVPGAARQASVRVALSNSFGFGGHNATIALRAL